MRYYIAMMILVVIVFGYIMSQRDDLVAPPTVANPIPSDEPGMKGLQIPSN